MIALMLSCQLFFVYFLWFLLLAYTQWVYLKCIGCQVCSQNIFLFFSLEFLRFLITNYPIFEMWHSRLLVKRYMQCVHDRYWIFLKSFKMSGCLYFLSMNRFPVLGITLNFFLFKKTRVLMTCRTKRCNRVKYKGSQVWQVQMGQ